MVWRWMVLVLLLFVLSGCTNPIVIPQESTEDSLQIIDIGQTFNIGEYSFTTNYQRNKHSDLLDGDFFYVKIRGFTAKDTMQGYALMSNYGITILDPISKQMFTYHENPKTPYLNGFEVTYDPDDKTLVYEAYFDKEINSIENEIYILFDKINSKKISDTYTIRVLAQENSEELFSNYPDPLTLLCDKVSSTNKNKCFQETAKYSQNPKYCLKTSFPEGLMAQCFAMATLDKKYCSNASSLNHDKGVCESYVDLREEGKCGLSWGTLCELNPMVSSESVYCPESSLGGMCKAIVSENFEYCDSLSKDSSKDDCYIVASVFSATR